MASENKLQEVVQSTLAQIRNMIDANTVIGTPVETKSGTTIIPISKISIGLGGGGSDFVSKNVNRQENPFGGGVGAGAKVTPVAFLIIKDGTVRMLPVATPANTTTDRLVEMIPETLERITSFIDSKTKKTEE